MTSVQFSSANGLYNLFIMLIVFILIGAIIGFRVYLRRYVGTGHQLEPARLWKKYGKVAIALLVIAIGYANLDHYCSFHITTGQPSYAAGEAVEVQCIVSNPLPLPIYYRGHTAIDIETSYQNGSKVQKVYLNYTEAAAEAATEASRAATGEPWGEGFISPNGDKIVKTVRYTPMREGEVLITAELTSFTKVSAVNKSIVITEYDPILVNVNSTGITLFAEPSQDQYPNIVIQIRNDNSYPIRIPVFSYITRWTGTPDSDTKTVTYISWTNQHWDIPPYSTKTIWDTGISAKTIPRPTYFRLYGKTLVYPPLD
ncbi:MAG: hypothetical protein V1924_07720 [Candidatus Bathyarchaeota archaeon]